eukprot:GFUD01012491.1.p1 GENE.GFUD01012491.1~~GFUD01012491.1.p1  ORF type:complete len:231 (-),score=77.61 GFUD01012491.1:171-863(-)
MKSITGLFTRNKSPQSLPSQPNEAQGAPGTAGALGGPAVAAVPVAVGNPAPASDYTAKVVALLHSPGIVSDLLAVGERRTGLDRIILVGVILAVSFLSLVIGFGAGLLSRVVGFLYPAYESVKALHFKEKDKEKRWLTYWVVFSFFHVLEFFSDHLVWWVPFYWLVKTIFFGWCMAPIGQNGSMVIYTLVIKPLYSKHHEDIDNVMDNAVKEAGELLEMAAEKARRISVQ